MFEVCAELFRRRLANDSDACDARRGQPAQLCHVGVGVSTAANENAVAEPTCFFDASIEHGEAARTVLTCNAFGLRFGVYESKAKLRESAKESQNNQRREQEEWTAPFLHALRFR